MQVLMAVLIRRLSVSGH